MATKNNQPVGERSRVRFIMVDFDGTSSDMQQLAHTFAAAVKAPPQNIIMMQPPAHQNGVHPAIELAQAPLNGNGHIHEPVSEEVHQDAFIPPAPPKAQNAAKKKLRTPVLLSELDFTSGAKPFKTYWQEQTPEQQSKQYLVCMQWLKEHRGITEVGADHIYTLFRAVGLNVPADVLGVLRGLKKGSFVEKGTKQGFFKITHIGEGLLKKTSVN